MKRSPADKIQSSRTISRRALMLGGLQLGLVGALAARMRFLQVDEADKYRLLADENRINIRLLPPARGLIYDRRGVLLAGNEQNYRIVMVREDAGDIDEAVAKLATLVKLDPEKTEQAIKELKRRSAFVPVTIADRVSWEEVARVAVNAPTLPGIFPEVGLSRIYPLQQDFAHIIGYVGPVSDYDLQRIDDKDPLLQIPRFQIGKSGVEAKLERSLRGSAGTRQIEVNAVGRVMRELNRKEGEPGKNVQLSVDQALQNFVQARLALDEESASAVVMDVETGDLVAVGSAPSFDPNKFIHGISSRDYKALLDNPYRPLANKAAQGTYPPGSTFKMIVALAALAEGVIDSEERITCTGYIETAGRRFHCWRRGGHGKVDLVKSLRESCDVYYYEIAQRVGIEKISAMARKLGLGYKHELPLSGVARGLAPTKAWKLKHRSADWLIGDTINAGIGQGYVLASPLQLAIMTARIATGRAVLPRLVRSFNGVEVPLEEAPPLDIDPEHLSIVRRGMYEVVYGQRATAGASKIIDEDKRMAGKTGTSQVRNISKAERAAGVIRNEDLPWERRDHALFVSYAPYDAPKYAVSVVAEHGGGGSTAAAPIARDIMLFALYGELPPLSAYPSSQRRKIRERFSQLQLRAPVEPTQGRGRA